MADKTALAESSQALFCAVADFLGERKSEKVFDIKKYLTYTDFKRAIGEGVVSQAEKRIRTPGVSLSDIETFLGKNNDWYKSSVLIAFKLVKDITGVDADFKLKQEGFQNLFYFRGDQEVMGNIEKLFKIANKSPITEKNQVKFGNVNKWSPADIYLATDKARGDISKALQNAKPKSYSFIDLNILTSNLIDSGDLLPLSLKKTTKTVQLQKVNFDKKDEIKALEKISLSPKKVTNWQPYKKVPFGTKGETRDMRAFLKNGGEIKFRHDPSAKRFVAEFIGGGAEARGGSIGSIKLFCELFELVDKETSKKVLKEYQEGEKQYFIDLKLIENLRGTDKKLFDHERGAISAINIINRIMPILKNWFTKTDQKKVDDFIKIIYQYITSRTPLSGKFIIAKG
jgi:hypothetical protein|tara:strand:+ start:135 stop:1331 length:1197 start_codon:yes stop_codon:yes gene_type:complete